MVDKKIFLFSLLLFASIYLFILFDRLGNGLPARLLLSLVLALLLISTMAQGIGWGVYQSKNKFRGASYETILSIIILDFIISIIYFYSIERGGGGPEDGLAFIILIPFLTLAFIIFSWVSLSVTKYLLSDIKKLQKAVYILIFISSLLLGLVIFFLVNCTTDGCKNPKSLVEKALLEKDPSICKERQLKLDLKSYLPPLFITDSDPFIREDSREECFSYYASKRPDGLPPQINSCIEMGFNWYDCINLGLEKLPYPTQCEGLQRLDRVGNNLKYNLDQMLSSCYMKLALLQNEEVYCKRVNPIDSRNKCYADVALKKGDERICGGITQKESVDNNVSEQKYMTPYYDSKDKCSKLVRKKQFLKDNA